MTAEANFKVAVETSYTEGKIAGRRDHALELSEGFNNLIGTLRDIITDTAEMVHAVAVVDQFRMNMLRSAAATPPVQSSEKPVQKAANDAKIGG